MNPEPAKLIDDCFLHDKDRLKHEEALQILQERLRPVVGAEQIPLAEGYRRILAENIIAPRKIPATDNSAVDGYAFCYADFEETGGFFPVVARIPARMGEPLELPPKTAARIFTGAVMPENADTVAMQEDCEPHEQEGTKLVAIPQGLGFFGKVEGLAGTTRHDQIQSLYSHIR